MSDRGPEGQDGAEPTQPPSEADLAIILGGDPDAVTTTSHDIIKAGFDDSLADDADDVALVPAEPIASPRVGEEEHVVPRAKRRWWFSRHHHRETDQGEKAADRSSHAEHGVGGSGQVEASPAPSVGSSPAAPGSAADPLAWLPSEPKSEPKRSVSANAPDSAPAKGPDAAHEAASEAAPDAASEAAPDAAPVYETRASRRAKRHD